MARAVKKNSKSVCQYPTLRNWEDVKQHLNEGNERYKSGNLKHPNQQPECRELWGPPDQKQQPWCIVISCADSRVTPELVFDTGIGELFVVRVAGNIANASSLASIEYAAHALKKYVKAIVVLGHESCGAVSTAVSLKEAGQSAPSPALQHLVGHIMPALQKKPTGKDTLAGYIRANARLAAQDLLSRSKIIHDSKLPVVPAYYRLKSGDVEFLPEVTR